MGVIDHNGIQIPTKVHNTYIDGLISKIFKILPIYEDCLYNEDYDISQYDAYLNKILTMLIGSEYLYDGENFGDIVALLKGLQIRRDLSQKEVKSIVFHCIDVLDKMKKIGE